MFTRQLSIKWKIFLFMSGFCILLLIILWLFQTVLLDSFYKNIKFREIQNEAEIVAGYIEKDDWEGLIKLVAHRGDLCVEVWTPVSSTSVVTGNYPDGIQAQLGQADKQELYLEVQQAGSSVVRRYFSEDAFGVRDRESILHAQLLEVQGIPQLLMVSANITPVNATVDTLRVQLQYITIIMIFLSTAFAILIAHRVSKPIEQINDAAKNLGRGCYNVKLGGSTYREVLELDGTLTDASIELRKTEDLRRELIANVSHDLRTPLTLVTGYTQMMQDLPGENTPENLQVIVDECKRLTSLVNDLLDLSKLQSGAQKLELSRFNLTEELRGIIARVAKLCEQEGCAITFSCQEDVCVTADITRINQVVYNFLINAINHTGPDKSVQVCQLIKDGRVDIQVADAGPGISQELLPHIWERYYKVDKEHKRFVAGTGLGLSIVKTILDQHPGVEYGVRSHPGQGSVFWFSLEVAGPEEPQ